MLIKTKTTYTLLDEEFKNLNEAKKHVENCIGKIIDSINPRLPPKQALDLLNIIVKNKTEIVKLLSIEFEQYDEGNFLPGFINILDL